MSDYENCRLVGLNWDEEEVPKGFVDLTFRIPDTGQGFNAKMTANITLQ